MTDFSFSNWIFDLDFTLYQIDKPKNEFTYSDLNYNPRLISNLQKINGRRILFTNANLMHTLACIRILKLEKIFHKVSCRELHGLKPHFFSYISLYRIANIQKEDKCFFFDDLIENLVAAKNFGWFTILINPTLNEKDYINNQNIDFYFPNINEALDYFLTNDIN